MARNVVDIAYDSTERRLTVFYSDMTTMTFYLKDLYITDVVVNNYTKEITFTYSNNSKKTFSIAYLFNNMYTKTEIEAIFAPLSWGTF